MGQDFYSEMQGMLGEYRDTKETMKLKCASNKKNGIYFSTPVFHVIDINTYHRTG